MFYKKLLSVLIIFLIFFSIIPVNAFSNSFDSISFQKQINSCQTNSLSKEDVQRLWDEILLKGFKVESFAGDVVVKDKDALKQNSILLRDDKGKMVLQQDLPNKKISAREVPFLSGNWSNGAFSFGLLLDDSMRIGRCASEDKDCALKLPGLKYRSSGVSLIEHPIDFSKETINKFLKKEVQIEENQDNLKQLNDLNNALTEVDSNTVNVKVVSRKENLMKNSILTDEFDARLSTNCKDEDCALITYSMFDRLFNLGLSATMLTTTFGPTIFTAINKALPLKLQNFTKKIFKFRFGKDSLSAFKNNLKKQLDTVGKKAEFEKLDAAFANKSFNVTDWFEGDKALFKTLTPEQRRVFLKATNTRNIQAASAELQFNSIFKGKEIKDFTEKEVDNLLDIIDGLNSGALKSKVRLYQDLQGKAIALPKGSFVPSQFAEKIQKLDGDTVILKLDKVSDNVGVWKDMIHGKYSFKPGTLELFEEKEGRELLGSFNLDYLKSLKNKSASEVFYKNNWVKVSELDFKKLEAEAEKGLVSQFRLREVGGWVKEKDLPINDFKFELLHNSSKTIKNIREHSDDILKTAQRTGMRTQYYSITDYLAHSTGKTFFDYFTTKGLVSWTVVPWAYWIFKRGASDFMGKQALPSAYLIPANWKWTEFFVSHDNEASIYDDAYIDFFANEGFDSGDLFRSFLKSIVFFYSFTLDVVIKDTKFKAFLERVTGKDFRYKVDDLAVYLSGSNDCRACSVNITTGQRFKTNFVAKENLNTYVLEDSRSKGTNLMAFAHHTNIKGLRTDETNNDSIKIDEALRKKESCEEKLKNVPLVAPLSKLLSKIGLSESLGAGVSTEVYSTLAYVIPSSLTVFGGPGSGLFFGITSSFLIQKYITDNLAECIDTKEGYYLQLFIPEKKKEKASTDALSNTIQQGKNVISSALSSQLTESVFGEKMQELSKQIDSIVKSNEAVNVVQATLSLSTGLGTLDGFSLFYFWVQGGALNTPSDYKTTGKEELKIDGNNLVFDNSNGILSINGKQILGKDKADFVRLSSTDLGIPAKVIPMTLTFVPLPSEENLLFEINSSGDLFIKNNLTENCIVSGANIQTGQDFSSLKNLSLLMGKVTNLTTTDFKQVLFEGNKIIANDAARVSGGSNSKVDVFSDRVVKLIGPDYGLGNLISISFENGFLIYKPDTNYLIFWVRHKAEAFSEDIASLDATLTSVKNPLTDCDEPAVNLSTKGFPEIGKSKLASNKMNKALASSGPFQIFETESKMFLFYSKLEEGECKDFMKVIDKKSGKATEYPIASITQTPKGFKVIDSNGTEHDFAFSSKNGVPTLKYNDLVENLLRAQGRNGAFWYDPEKGVWYSDNAQLIPLLEAFKQNGLTAQPGADGRVSAKPASNFLVLPSANQSDSLLAKLPSLPENLLLLSLTVFSLITLLYVIRRSIIK